MNQILEMLECNPVIAAIKDDKWQSALKSPVKVIFYTSANLLTIRQKVAQAHQSNKYVMVHLDLAEGIGKDKTGIRFLADCGVDGIISTKGQLIRIAKELGLFTIQRFFAVDSDGAESIGDVFRNNNPHLMEIMPGVVTKIIQRYSKLGFPVIAGGLIQTKAEITDILSSGATAVSTGTPELWYM